MHMPSLQFRNDTVQAILWSEDSLKLLDQRKLPHEETYIKCTNATSVADAIRSMVVRGAPAIGIVAAYGVVLSAKQHFTGEGDNWKASVKEDLEILAQSRPTAVNLFWALKQMRQCLERYENSSDVVRKLEAEAKRIHDSDIAANQAMAQYGAKVIEDDPNHGDSILTHCNTGSLATGGYGTALGVIRACYEMGIINRVYADETRPWLQGARLTAWELLKDDIPCRLIADGAAAHTMRVGDIGWVVVGADRIAANGDVANKIGTYGLAVAAQFHDVKFMVVAPSTTIDMDVPAGEDIVIEERDESELLQVQGKVIAPVGARASNPVFDVTPYDLIDVLVTEKGVVDKPDADKMKKLMCRNNLH